MNLLSKLSSSTKAKTIEPREIFMTLPSKAPGYGYPRDVQSEVWKKWFDIRNEKNVILKMNTGSGKTVVGLIMLQSCLNEDMLCLIIIWLSRLLMRLRDWEFLQRKIKMIIAIQIQKQFLLLLFRLL